MDVKQTMAKAGQVAGGFREKVSKINKKNISFKKAIVFTASLTIFSFFLVCVFPDNEDTFSTLFVWSLLSFVSISLLSICFMILKKIKNYFMQKGKQNSSLKDKTISGGEIKVFKQTMAKAGQVAGGFREKVSKINKKNISFKKAIVFTASLTIFSFFLVCVFPDNEDTFSTLFVWSLLSFVSISLLSICFMILKKIKNYFMQKGKQNSSLKDKTISGGEIKVFKYKNLMRKINSVIFLILLCAFLFAIFFQGEEIKLLFKFSLFALLFSSTAAIAAEIYYFFINKFNKRIPSAKANIKTKDSETQNTKEPSLSNLEKKIKKTIPVIVISLCISIFSFFIYPKIGLLLFVMSSVFYCAIALVRVIHNVTSKDRTPSFISTKATKRILITVGLVLFSGIYFADSNSTNFELVEMRQVPNITEKFFQYQRMHYVVDDNVLYYPSSDQYEFLVTPGNAELFGNDPIVLKGSPEDFNSLIMEILFDVEYANSLGLVSFGGGMVAGAENIVKGIMDIILHPIDMLQQLFESGKSIVKLSYKITTGEVSAFEIKQTILLKIDDYWNNYKTEQAKAFGFEYSKIVFPVVTEDILKTECLARKSGEITTEIITFIAAYYVTVEKLRHLKFVKNAGVIVDESLNVIVASRLARYAQTITGVLPSVRKGAKYSQKFRKRVKSKRSSSLEKPYVNARPPYSQRQVENVWKNSEQPNGKHYDPNTGEEIFWDRSKPRNGQWDMGHKKGHEYSKLHKDYMDGKITKEEFVKEYQNPDKYQVESVSGNRSHKYEG